MSYLVVRSLKSAGGRRQPYWDRTSVDRGERELIEEEKEKGKGHGEEEEGDICGGKEV